MRLYLDEDSDSRALLLALRGRGVDCLTVSESGRRGKPDAEQLAFSTAEGRTVFTKNTRDYVRLHREWLSAGGSHGGIICLTDHRLSVGAQTMAITRLNEQVAPAEWVDRLEFLKNYLARS